VYELSIFTGPRVPYSNSVQAVVQALTRDLEGRVKMQELKMKDQRRFNIDTESYR